MPVAEVLHAARVMRVGVVMDVAHVANICPADAACEQRRLQILRDSPMC
jgi:hypothetical protein